MYLTDMISLYANVFMFVTLTRVSSGKFMTTKFPIGKALSFYILFVPTSKIFMEYVVRSNGPHSQHLRVHCVSSFSSFEGLIVIAR